MKGIYLEYDTYKMSEVASKEVDALRTLGIKFTLDFDNQIIKIVEDTSEQDHSLCDDEDVLALVKSLRQREMLREGL